MDPFCGCGVVALEAAGNGRHVVAGDWNPYAVLLTRAKLFPPRDQETAESRLQRAWNLSRERVGKQDLRTVPQWVRRFFHPETLRNALAFRDVCLYLGDEFLLACLLGILHHQRPGFLSYPSSHLVPYLRNQKFLPRSSPIFTRSATYTVVSKPKCCGPSADARRVYFLKACFVASLVLGRFKPLLPVRPT